MKKKLILSLILFLHFGGFALAQTNTTTSSKDSLKRAADFGRAGLHDRAREIYLGIAENDRSTTQSVAARFSAAVCLYSMGQYDAFTTEATRLIARYPKANQNTVRQTQLKLARVPYNQGKWQEAADKMAAFVAAKPDSNHAATALAYQADALRRLKNFEEARAAFLSIGNAKHSAETWLEAKHRAAHCLFEMKEYTAFIAEAEALFAENPIENNQWVQMTRYHLAQVPNREGRPLESAQKMREFIKIYPMFRYAHLAVKSCESYYREASEEMVRKGQWPLANAFLEEGNAVILDYRSALTAVIESDPTTVTVRYPLERLMKTYESRNDFQGMARAADVIGEKLPYGSKQWASSKLWAAMARTRFDPPQFEEAKGILNSILAANVSDTSPKDHAPTTTLFWLAAIAQQQHDYDAIEKLKDRLLEMPDSGTKENALSRISED